jgi:sortase (surface protein transpeptidase)
MFALMLLTPVAANASAAGQFDAQRDLMAQATEEPEGELQPEVTEEPVIEETEEPVVEETEEPVIEETEEPQGEQLGAFEIDYWECDPGYDIANPDLDNLFEECEGVDGVQFQIETSDGGSGSQATGEFGDAHVSFTEVPTGNTTVRQASPIGEIAVYCNGIVQNGGPETGLMTVPAQNGAIDWNLLDEEVVFCSWLTATEGEQVGAVEIEYRECAAGYTFLDGTDEDDLDQMLMECAQVDGVEFTIDEGGPDGDTQLTGEFGDSHVSFTEVPTGMRTVSQTTSFEDTYVVCEGIVQNGGPETGVMEMTVTNGAIEWDLLDDEVAFCNWFVMAGAGTGTEVPGTETATEVPGTETATEEPTGELVGSFEIEYRECAEGYAFLDGTDEDLLDQMLMECIGVNDVEFQVMSGSYSATQLTGEFGDYHVSLTEVPTGMSTVTQTNAPATLVIYCEGIVSNGGPETGVMMMPVANGAIEWNLLDDEIVYCNWFAGAGAADATETPENEQVGSINVDYWECPAGYDVAAADPTALETDCTSGPNGIPFQVSNAGGVIETQNTGDINDGVVAFANVPTGIVSITQVNAPAVPRVWCEGIVSNGGPETGLMELSAPSGSVEWNLLDDEVVDCDWYTVPMGEPGDLTINKWTCPEGYDPYAPGANPPVDCTEATDGVTFVLSDNDPATTDLQTDTGDSIPGAVRFGGIAPGNYTITETLPEGTESAFVWDCDFLLLTFGGQMPISEGPTFNLPFNGGSLTCNWYNVPGTDSTVTVTKWYCPEGVSYEEDQAYYEQTCTQYHEGVDFKLTHGEGSTFDTTDANGQAAWTGVPMGPFSIQEYIPAEYGEPIVFCGFTAFVDGAIVDGFPQRVDAPNGYHESALELPNTSYFCHWFNVPGEPGEITVYKYTCPEGYDLYAWGANPKDDCPETTNGINFTLVDEDPGTVDLQTMTGDSIDGAVYFGGLEPGPYTVIETVPAGTGYVFVLDCYGQNMGELRPYPLEMGDTLDIHLSSGESIVCYWYNVPEYDPDYGRITVYKYDCWTPEYTSDVDCEVYEDGKEFDLVFWDGDSWEYADTKTTDGAGKIMWINVEPGEYWLDEQDGDWCHLESEQISDDGNWINVYDGQETVIEVYNCGGKEPGTPGKTPTKYPNTGVGPGQGPEAPAELPAFAPLAGLLALLASRRTRQAAALVSIDHDLRRGAELVSAPVPGTEESAMTTTTFTRRRLAALLTVPLGGTALFRSGLLAQAGQVIEPIEGTPGGTPTSLCLPGTPGAGNGEGEGDGDGQGSGQGNGQGDGDPSTSAADECRRGPVPVGLRIEAIGVDAPVEILETVGGVMQQPSDEAHVAWYKESARLGETGNAWIAGHLNWWGHPEAVFFALGTLREGDTVVLLDEEENAYTYEVEWVRQESNLEPPAEDVLGMTPYEAVTLMTCGGQWDSSISEYDERTVARAKRVADEGTPEA